MHRIPEPELINVRPQCGNLIAGFSFELTLIAPSTSTQPASVVKMETPVAISSSTASAKKEFVCACRQGDIAAVDRLISEGRTQGAETLREMLESGDQEGWTPLFLASFDGRDAVVERLLAAGANIDALIHNGATPLYVACQNGHLEVVERLLAAGANIEAQTIEGAAPLFMACQEGHQEVLERLLAAGAKIDAPISAPMNDGVTPLHIACDRGHQLIAKLLLSAGANPNVTLHSCTLKPIDAARQQNHSTIVTLLSQPLPEATVAAHQQRIREIKAQQEEAKAHYLRDK